MSCQYCIDTITDALTGLEDVPPMKLNRLEKKTIVHFNASCITAVPHHGGTQENLSFIKLNR